MSYIFSRVLRRSKAPIKAHKDTKPGTVFKIHVKWIRHLALRFAAVSDACWVRESFSAPQLVTTVDIFTVLINQ